MIPKPEKTIKEMYNKLVSELDECYLDIDVELKNENFNKGFIEAKQNKVKILQERRNAIGWVLSINDELK